VNTEYKITDDQIVRTRKFINEILPAAGMTGNISQKINTFVLLNTAAASFEDIEENAMSETLSLFESMAPADLVAYIDASLAPAAPTEQTTLDDATVGAEGETVQREAQTSFFESIAMPLIGRGFKVAPCFPHYAVDHDGTTLGKTVDLPDPLNQRSNDPAQIHAWGLAKPHANVCVYAVQENGGLCFIDKDGAVSLVV
jgi:hypothetical protein